MKELKVSLENGLSTAEVKKRQEQYGPNELKREGGPSGWKVFLSQFSSPFMAILAAAIVVSLIVKNYVDAGVIGGIVLLNSLLGFFQEYRAERSLEALRRMITLKAKVLRNGKKEEINSEGLVPGDILLLFEGDKIPADGRIVEEYELQTQEAVLTGESIPTEKHSSIVSEKAGIMDQDNMVFSGTSVIGGEAKAVITSIGQETAFGRIARSLKEVKEEKTPLQEEINSFSRGLIFAVSLMAGTIFLTSYFLRGESLANTLLVAIALAIAVIPEGLPAVITISFALGAKYLLQKKVLVRKLPAVETLGSVNVICTDKTGTLTENEMTVKKIWAGGKIFTVSGEGYSSMGNLFLGKRKINPMERGELRPLLEIGLLCNNAELTGEKEVIGDPTEAALLVSAAKLGLERKKLSLEKHRLREIPFSSERKKMTVILHTGKKDLAYTKGAVGHLLHSCAKVLWEGEIIALTDKLHKEIIFAEETLAGETLRVIGFAYKELTGREKKVEEIESGMIFAGMQAMKDPPRPEVKTALAECQSAGIRVVMITGDHLATAKAIAEELGIKGEAISGEELKRRDLNKLIDSVNIFARIDPEQKLQIVKALQKKGNVVAVTGDGVNDAPALKKAEIGVAMGIRGTEVSKEAADLILLDDNFSSIVKAVEEGRKIYHNIKKFIIYLFAGNVGELLIVFFALLMGWPLPLTAIQILWINVVTETIPAAALSFEKENGGVMKQAPRRRGTKILQGKEWGYLTLICLTIVLGTLFIFYYLLKQANYATAMTGAFTALVLFQMFNVFNSRSLKSSLFDGIRFFSNKWLLLAVFVSLVLQGLVVYLPALNKLFGAVPLGARELLVIVPVAASVLVVGEVIKLIWFKK